MENLKEYNLSKQELQSLQEAIITTKNGDMKFKLFYNDAPTAVSNFAYLAQSGFYDGLSFHRVIKGFMAQGGCPIGNGTGGPGYRIRCEVANNKNKHERGTLSMAHAGRDTGGSQFFICFVPCPHLNGEHTTFGAIDPSDSASLKVLDAIEQNDTIEKITIVKK